jgi:hypothetical protein
MLPRRSQQRNQYHYDSPSRHGSLPFLATTTSNSNAIAHRRHYHTCLKHMMCKVNECFTLLCHNVNGCFTLLYHNVNGCFTLLYHKVNGCFTLLYHKSEWVLHLVVPDDVICSLVLRC